MENDPRIHSMKLTDFKGISKVDISLEKSLTLIAGRNGVGKTSILEAVIASTANVWDYYFETSSNYNDFQLSDIVRVGSATAKSELCLTLPGGNLISLSLTSKGKSLRCSSKYLRQMHGQQWPITPLPIIYYRQDRVSQSESEIAYRRDDYSLDAGLHSVSEFKKWFFEKEGDEGREVKERRDLNYSDPDLDVIRQVLTEMEGLDSIRSRLKEDSTKRILYIVKHSLPLPFDSLSSGEKAFFILAVDLARRLILRYPGVPLSECRAVVCIDEIELHLHPTWQRRILGQLTDIFPVCQFIVSTHSPQVIGGVQANNVRLLTQDEDGVVNAKVPSATKGRDSNYILEALLDATERDVEINELLLSFDERLDEKRFDDAEKLLDELDRLIEGSSSRIAAKRAKLNRRRSEDQ